MNATSIQLLTAWADLTPPSLADWVRALKQIGLGEPRICAAAADLFQTGAQDAPVSVAGTAGTVSTVVLGPPAAVLAWLTGRGAWSGGPLSGLGPAPTPAQAQALLAAGVTGWWPQAPAAEPATPAWLAAVLAWDRARWQHEQATLSAHERVRAQLDDRKWVDRAKGVLMTARGMDEHEAFGLLRGAAMQANLRLGEVSRSVTEAAQWADGINRAGQLRMLSQRLVKLCAQRLAGVDARQAKSAQQQAMARVQETLGILLQADWLAQSPRVQAAIHAVDAAWQDVQALLSPRLSVAQLLRLDQAAEALLTRSESLVLLLEQSADRRTLGVINLCGRQRMRVQRLAKLALLTMLVPGAPQGQALPALLEAFEEGLRALEKAPLSSPEIQEGLSMARDAWLGMLRGLRQADADGARVTHEETKGRSRVSSSPSGGLERSDRYGGAEETKGRSRVSSSPSGGLERSDRYGGAICHSADALLEVFERLTAAYGHSLQVIMA